MTTYSPKQLTAAILCMSGSELIQFANALAETAPTDPNVYRYSDLEATLRSIIATIQTDKSLSYRSQLMHNFWYIRGSEPMEANLSFLPINGDAGTYHRNVIKIGKPFRGELTFVEDPNPYNPFLFTESEFIQFVNSLDFYQLMRFRESSNPILIQAMDREIDLRGKILQVRIYLI